MSPPDDGITPAHLSVVRAMLEKAEVLDPLTAALTEPAADGPPPPDGPPPDDGEGPGDDGGPDHSIPFPAGCPVRPLGMNNRIYYYLDEVKQLAEMAAKDHSRLNIQSMFGRRTDLLYEFWPRKVQDKQTGGWDVVGWRPELAAETLMTEAARCGVWSPRDLVRGSGGWRGPDGELILHMGDALFRRGVDGADAGDVIEPGVVGRMVYPTAPRTMRPADGPQPPGSQGPGGELLALLRTWAWRRPDVDPYLMMGWIGAAMLGAALHWRPVSWVTGGAGTGKSSLQSLLKWIMGPNGMLQSSDATPAGVRQVLKHSSQPVAIDEGEPEDERRMASLVKLARDAATGSLSVRGSSDHQAATFTVASCFLFSSILIPPLMTQDRSRIAIFNLDPLKPDQVEPTITERMAGELGQRLLRRLVQQWPRFARTLETYRLTMSQAGHTKRGQDVYGTLLTCADLLLHDYPPDSETLDGWRGGLAAEKILEDGIKDEDACLQRLLTTTVEASHDRRRLTVADWILRAAGESGEGDTTDTQAAANKVLSLHGIKVVWHELKPYLAVANSHEGLSEIYARTQWADKPGAEGVWVQSFRRLPHLILRNERGAQKTVWIGGACKATLLPLTLCLPPDRHGPAQKPPPDGAGLMGATPTRGADRPGPSGADPAQPWLPSHPDDPGPSC